MTHECSGTQPGPCSISHTQVGSLTLNVTVLSFLVLNSKPLALPRLVDKDLVPSRRYSCLGSSAAVLGFRGSVLRLHRPVQHCRHPGASPEVAEHRGTLFIEVSFDPHVVLCSKGNRELKWTIADFKG